MLYVFDIFRNDNSATESDPIREDDYVKALSHYDRMLQCGEIQDYVIHKIPAKTQSFMSDEQTFDPCPLCSKRYCDIHNWCEEKIDWENDYNSDDVFDPESDDLPF